MTKIGGYTKTRQYVRRQRAMGRFRSPYQKGGTLIGQTMTPFFPTRAKLWQLPWQQPPMGRIKAVHRRRKRKRR